MYRTCRKQKVSSNITNNFSCIKNIIDLIRVNCNFFVHKKQHWWNIKKLFRDKKTTIKHRLKTQEQSTPTTTKWFHPQEHKEREKKWNEIATERTTKAHLYTVEINKHFDTRGALKFRGYFTIRRKTDLLLFLCSALKMTKFTIYEQCKKKKRANQKVA